ncbi:LysR family transcriptional regulator [Paraburkholderia terrae]|nr:LysR family transcriptional regulator [Paraburkholderia sp. 22B1P]GJH06766.1 LysR family transcriptional regulator [Paraburkholderia terrae]GJH38701.1 LysR family transcriptional regulator [Paraburkholderia hospita]
MRIFVHVADLGSFTAAASRLETSTGSVSRAIGVLEQHLQTRLFQRTTRRTILTEAGEAYLDRCRKILDEVDEAEAEANAARTTPHGRLKIHSISNFGQHYIVPVVAKYRQAFPDVRIDLSLGQRVPNVIDEGFDVSIVSASRLDDSSLISQRIGDAFSVLCAAPVYIEKYGMPASLEGLTKHLCLQLVTPVFPGDKWKFDGPNGRETVSIENPVFSVNVPEAMAVAIRQGLGIGFLPAPAALDDLRRGSMVRVLSPYTLEKMTVYAQFPSRRYLNAKVRSWIDFVQATLPPMLKSDERTLHQLAG